MKRRWLLSGMVSAPVILAGMPASAAHAAPAENSGPPTITPKDLRFRPRELRYGSARQAGLTKRFVDDIVEDTAAYMEPGPQRPRPSHPGFVVLTARRGVVVAHEAGGYALRYSSYDEANDAGVELPEDERVPMAKDTIFDIASMSKLFCAMVATQMAEQGDLDLDAPVADYIPRFASTDSAKEDITIRYLLRHVSGMPASLPLYDEPDNAARMRLIYDCELQRKPGSGYEYSDMNLITLGAVIEKITGKTLDVEVAERIAKPLGLKDTEYNPPKSKRDRIAATEYQEGRGIVRGEVHDENAHSFGGVAGHAGVFSTARDVAVFAQTILNGGEYDGVRLLSESSVRALLTEYNDDLPADAGRGLGWQLNQFFYMDAMSSPLTAGHTGFTGTCVVLDPIAETLFVLLTNRVHPTRNWGVESEYRRAPARDLARAVPVEPRSGKAWYSPLGEDTARLSAPLPHETEQAELGCHLWYDTEPSHRAELRARGADGDWQRVPITLRAKGTEWETDGAVSGFSARTWMTVGAQLPAGTTAIRWSYSGADPSAKGRGVYVDKLVVRDGNKVIFNSERPADAASIDADGWERVAD